MGTKRKLAKAGFERIKNYTNSMTKNSTNNMSKNGRVDRLIDTHFAKFDNLVKNKRKDYMDAAKSIRPNINDSSASMAVGAAGMYGVMKAKEKNKVKPVQKKPRKPFMNTKVKD